MNLPNKKTNTGETLSEIAERGHLLLVFLRHFGCTFSRETMSDLARSQDMLKSAEVRTVLVHMSPTEVANAVFRIYELEHVPHISDTDLELYRHFDLGKVRRIKLMSLQNIWRSLVAGIFKGHWVGKVSGDPYQLPGAFLIHGNRILNTFTYRNVSDRLDLKKLLAPTGSTYSLSA